MLYESADEPVYYEESALNSNSTAQPVPVLTSQEIREKIKQKEPKKCSPKCPEDHWSGCSLRVDTPHSQDAVLWALFTLSLGSKN